MKKIIYSIVFCSLLFAVSSCKKTDGPVNPLSSINNFKVGSYLILDKTINENFNLNTIASSAVGVTVHQFAGGEKIDHIEVWASASSDYDTTKWKKVKSVPYAGDAVNLTVSGAELATALGVATSSFKPGISYTFFNRIFTKSGARYDVNNTGTNDGSGLNGGPEYKASFVFSGIIICPYVAPMAGTYKIITDDWLGSAGTLIKVTDGTVANTLDLSGAWPGDSGYPVKDHLIVKVDPATGAASVAAVTFMDMTTDGYGTAKANSGSGYVFSCTGRIQLIIDVTLSNPAYGAQGGQRLVLQKQ